MIVPANTLRFPLDLGGVDSELYRYLFGQYSRVDSTYDTMSYRTTPLFLSSELPNCCVCTILLKHCCSSTRNQISDRGFESCRDHFSCKIVISSFRVTDLTLSPCQCLTVLEASLPLRHIQAPKKVFQSNRQKF